jgi:hypothetical protein
MARNGTGLLLIALVIFLIYFGNVALGAADQSRFLTDVMEMLTLLLSVIFFVAGVLIKEANAPGKSKK